MLAKKIISRETVITKLKESIEDEYTDSNNLLAVCKVIGIYDNYIYDNIDNELYKKLELEFDTSYKEYQYGDNNKYSHLVYNDLVEVVKKVIDAL